MSKRLMTARINGDLSTWYLRPVDFRKTYYILPNLFTLSSVFCGFISISLSASGQGGADLYQAALAICFGFFFDTADGRVARLTRTQTDLGRELDSLADLVTFGVAPGMLVYKWGLTSFGRAGIFIAGLYVCAGAMRLARFNVLSRREEEAGHHSPGKYTLGLSIPAAASVLVLMVIATQQVPYRVISETFVAGVVLTLSYFMVSRIRFRSFKDIRFNRKTAGLVLLALGCGLLVAMNGVTKAIIFLVMITGYIILGITESIIFMKRHFVEKRLLRAQAAAAPPETPNREEAQQEEAVLRELGAFDQPDESAAEASGGRREDESSAAAPSSSQTKQV
jgi:CDP-diacylglycerol--serine O-phosphatidyltransferase